jgi:hypothetical protein
VHVAGAIKPTATALTLSLAVGALGVYLASNAGPSIARASGVALVAGGIVMATTAIGNFTIGVTSGYLFRRVQRRNARGLIIDHLASLIRGIEQPVGWRRYPIHGTVYAYRLELLADLHESGLPAQLTAFDPTTQEWVRSRCVGAAAAMRHAKRLGLSAKGREQGRFVRILRQQLAAVATENWMAMVHQPTAVQPTGNWRTRITSAVRVLIVAALPGLALLGISPWVDFGSDVGDWAKIVALGWGALTLIWALDPSVRDKIDTARNIVTSVRELNVKGPDTDSSPKGS